MSPPPGHVRALYCSGGGPGRDGRVLWRENLQMNCYQGGVGMNPAPKAHPSLASLRYAMGCISSQTGSGSRRPLSLEHRQI